MPEHALSAAMTIAFMQLYMQATHRNLHEARLRQRLLC
jgi:hypothetical protein